MAGQQASLIERGLQAYMHGFSATRSLTHPYRVRQLSPFVWVLSDAPRDRGNTRNAEVVVYGAGADEAIETIRREEIDRHAICVLIGATETVQATRDLYKRRGYRSIGSEALFVLPIEQRVDGSGFPVRRVSDLVEAETIRKAARGRQLLPEHLREAKAPIRLYGAFENETPIGWVSSVCANSDTNWVSNLFVHPEYRRRGIGKSLMSALLNDDAKYGVQHSALLANQAGAFLYPHLGYEKHGVLLIFTPQKMAP